jgi:putative ABC transport system permease protein
VQRLAGHPHEVTTIGVIVQLGANVGKVADELERDYPGLAAVTEPGQAVKVDTSSRLIIDTGWIFSLLALIVGGIGVTNTMAMSVLERVREIGILRAVGWRTSRIAAMIVSEALAIGCSRSPSGSRSGTRARSSSPAAARSRPWSSPTSPRASSPGGSPSRSAWG